MANNGGEPLVKLDPEGTAPILSYNVAQLSALSAIFDHRGDIQRDFVETRDIDGEQYQRINPTCSPPTRIPRGNPDAIKEISGAVKYSTGYFLYRDGFEG